MHYRLRTLMIWSLLLSAWGVLLVKLLTDRPSPAYPFGRGAEFGILGIILVVLTFLAFAPRLTQ